MPAVEPTRENPLSIKKINEIIQTQVKTFGSVWAEGEITSWQIVRGNIFGTLRDLDEDASLQLSMWRHKASALTQEFKKGDRVVVRMSPDYWVKNGSLSFNIQSIDHAGIGKTLADLEQLKQKLLAEGLFDTADKRPIPFLPNLVGLITGKDSDAEKDVIRNARLRLPSVQFKTVHSAVQGELAVHELCQAVETLDNDPDVDVIVIARGGGDFLHLLPFSDEKLLRCVAAATTPIVSAIGHDNDTPLLDFVADLRASTPTDAAKRIVPDLSEELLLVQNSKSRMNNMVNQIIANCTSQLASIKSRPAFTNPDVVIEQHNIEIQRLSSRCDEMLERKIGNSRASIDALRVGLSTLSPKATLRRGYAIMQNKDGDLIKSVELVQAGDPLLIRLDDGTVDVNAVAVKKL